MYMVYVLNDKDKFDYRSHGKCSPNINYNPISPYSSDPY